MALVARRVRSQRSGPGRGSDPFLDESFRDLEEDFVVLRYLARSMAEKLLRTDQELLQVRRHIAGNSLDLIEHQFRWLRWSYDGLCRELQELGEAARRGPRSLPVLAGLAERKRVVANHLRTLQGIAAAALTASEWQSPSFGHSMFPTSGRQTGRVTPHVDDYRRDRHPEAAAMEESFLREYIDDPNGFRLRALMTGCGMSAFVTILHYLTSGPARSAPLLIGEAVYHECKDLAKSCFGPRLVAVPETCTPAILRAVEDLRPSVVMLDSLCNARGIHVPDVPAILDRMRMSGADAHLVLDNTGLSCAFQPFRLLHPGDRVRLVSFESLTKFPQFGLDRAAAGMIVAQPEDATALDRLRENLGTNVPDALAHVIPQPNRSMLELRLHRLGRNATVLALGLQACAEQEGRGVVAGVAYPGLPNHPSRSVAKRLSFRGGFLMLEFGERFDRPEVRERFVKRALEVARERRVPLVAGASFGLDTTRIYETASAPLESRSLVRVSAGTEHRGQIEDLAEALCVAIRVSAGEERSALRG